MNSYTCREVIEKLENVTWVTFTNLESLKNELN